MKQGFFCLLLIVSLTSRAEEFVGKVIKVIDGNTLEVMSSSQEIRQIVLAGIDSPEPGQQFADKATRLLEKLLLEEEVTVKIEGKNRLGHHLAVVRTIKTEIDPRKELLEQGLAWTSERDPHPELELIRIKAQERGKGLWKETDPTPPWTYRRQQSMLAPKSR